MRFVVVWVLCLRIVWLDFVRILIFMLFLRVIIMCCCSLLVSGC